jgi:hypothetical protein
MSILWWEMESSVHMPVVTSWPQVKGSDSVELAALPLKGGVDGVCDWEDLACMREQAWAQREGLA